MDGIAKFISETYVENSIAERVPIENEREVFVDCESATRNEWTQAGRNGLNSTCVIKTQRINYSGEKIVEMDGVRYGVYRTYSPPDSDEIELYLEVKVGV